MTKDKTIILLLLGAVIVCLQLRQLQEPASAVSQGTVSVFVPQWNGKTVIMTKKSGGKTTTADTLEPPARLKPLFFQPLPINECDYRLLLTIPGVGPSTATEILKTRRADGSFDSADDLLKVKGIGPKKKEHLRRYVTF